MIQRLQTLLFLLAAAANIAVLFSPIAFSQSEESGKSLSAMGTYLEMQDTSMQGVTNQDPWQLQHISFYKTPWHFVMVLGVVVSSGMLLYAITQFKKRPFQITLGYAAIAVIFVQVVAGVLLSLQIERAIFPDGMPEAIPGRSTEFIAMSQSSFGLKYLPPVVILLAFWGIMRVKKDERLVKESSRLR